MRSFDVEIKETSTMTMHGIKAKTKDEAEEAVLRWYARDDNSIPTQWDSVKTAFSASYSEGKNYMTTKIYAHTIEYWWKDDEPRELNAEDVGRIKSGLERNQTEGALYRSNIDGETIYSGCWIIL